MSEITRYYNVLLPVVNSGIFTYSTTLTLEIGLRVAVNFNNRKMVGIVLEEIEKPTYKCKEIEKAVDNEPLFSKKYLEFILKMAEYYHSTPGLTLYGVLSEKLLALDDAEPVATQKTDIIDITYTNEQMNAINSIELDKFNITLIHGITGSGKTEVYLSIAKKVLAQGKKVLYIVPEISLTPQLVELVSKRLGYTPSSFHSKVQGKKRESTFISFARGDTQFVIGARSALFIPTKDLGLIIIDEEHEISYKQDKTPTYHLRDMAVLYASILNIPTVLGSATPSMESINNVKKGKYNLAELKNRPNNALLPQIHIVDLKRCEMIAGVIAEPIFDKLFETVEKGEQAIIFLNRKGYSTSLYCKSCGEVLQCDNCSVPVVYYKSKGVCNCKYCNTDYRKTVCKSCNSEEFNEYGIGTEKVEEILEELFPNKILRMDLDNITTLKALKSSLKKFESKEAQILIGTQLISKGLHFPDVTFVAILGIDNIISMPDFRSNERAFQQIVQVAGRAGRESLSGNVYIQTVDPNAIIFKYILDNDNTYYDYELERRESVGYPPYAKLIRLSLTHSNLEKVRDVATLVASALKTRCKNITTLGPVEDAIFMIKKKYCLTILLKSPNSINLKNAMTIALEIFDKNKTGAMIMKVDKDPYKF